MKKKRKTKILKFFSLIAVSLIFTGTIVAAVIGGIYFSHKKVVQDVVDDIDKKFSQIEEIEATADIDSAPSIKKNTSTQNGNHQTEKNDSVDYLGNVDYSPSDINVSRLREDSIKYNESLKQTQSTKLVGEESYTYAALDLSQYGIYNNIYGYVSAPSIDMKLPIYLGVTDDNMANGAAHFCYTSLPIGGKDTNCVLAGHTGYIGKWLFDSIKHLDIGDEVEVKTYISSLKYRVTDIKYKLPNESDDIYIEKGKDKITLVTCIYADDGTYMRCVVICERSQD